MNPNQELIELKKNWRRHIINSLVAVALLTLAAEIVMFIMLLSSGNGFGSGYLLANILKMNSAYFIFFYILLPSGLNLLSLWITHKLNESPKSSEDLKDYLTILSVCVLCFTVSTVHSYFPITMSAYVAPIFTASILDNRRAFRHTVSLCSVLMLIATFVGTCFDASWTMSDRLMTLCISLVIVYMFAAICLSLAMFFEKKNEIIRQGAVNKSELEYALKMDAMTGLFNHAEYHNYIQKHFGEDMSLSVFDLDNFKQINDTYGHMSGDEILIRTATIIRQKTEGLGLAFRYGGEEFVIIMPGADHEKTRTLLEDIRMTVYQQRFAFLGDDHITISGGFIIYDPSMETPSDFFQLADAHLYRAKASGRNQVWGA